MYSENVVDSPSSSMNYDDVYYERATLLDGMMRTLPTSYIDHHHYRGIIVRIMTTTLI